MSKKGISLASFSASGWLAVAPAILLVSFFLLIPAALGFLSSFTSFSPGEPGWKVVGLLNFQKILEDRTLGAAFTNGVMLTAFSVPLEIVLGLGVSALLRRPFKGRGLVRVLLLLPWLVSPMAAGVMWHYLYNGQVGIAGWLGSLLGSSYVSSPLANPTWALPALALTEVWRNAPLAAFLLLPGAIAVPQEQLDYALVEGGSGLVRWLNIILPQMRVLILTVLFLLVGESLGEFDSVLILTGGGPGTRTVTPALYSYNLAITSQSWPQGVSVAWLLEGLVLVVGVLYLFLAGREVRQ